MRRSPAKPRMIEASDLAGFHAPLAAASSQLRRVAKARAGVLLEGDAETVTLIAGELDALRALIRAAAWPASPPEPKHTEPHEASR